MRAHPKYCDCRQCVSDVLAAMSRPRRSADPINRPTHYTSHPSGIECIQVTEHMNFNRGNAVKYIWRADDKGDPVENLRKAAWYIAREIARLGGGE